MTNNLQRVSQSVTAPTVPRLIRVGFWCATLMGLGVLLAAAQPANDNFANGESIPGVLGSVVASNVGATSETGEPAHAGISSGASIWYRWTAPSTCQFIIDTIGSDFDTILAVYTGTNLNALTPIGSNDDLPTNLQSRVVINTVAGTEYLIAVDGYPGAGGAQMGNVILNWSTPVTPGNDQFDNAFLLAGDSGSTNGTTLGACDSTNEPRYHAVGNFTVWYQWTAPTSGQVTFDSLLISSEAVVAVYRGTGLNNLTPVPLFNTPVSSCATFFAVTGTVYRVAVSGGRTDFELNWTMNLSLSTNRFAGQFQFSTENFLALENDSSAAGFRSVRGAVVTVTRTGGSAGRALVDYRTMDEVPGNFYAAVISEITSGTNGPNSYTNSGTVNIYYTNAYWLSATGSLAANPPIRYQTNWVSTTGFCGTATNCIVTNVFQNCTTNLASSYGCPFADYFPQRGTLIFDDFETIKKFVVSVSSDFQGNGDKQVLMELFNQRLDPLELANPTGILPPTRTYAGSQATLNIREAFTVNGGRNFFIARSSYAVDESGGSVNVEVIHPSGSGGTVIIHVAGSQEEGRWVPSGGSDYASEVALTYTEPIYTDGTVGVPSAQDFTASVTTLTFGVGVQRQSINIPILDDGEVEFNEDIFVYLEGVPNQPPIAGLPARVTILADEQPAGALDREWNADNIITSTPRSNPTPGANNIVRAVAVQADDKSVIGGDFTAFNSFPRNRIARIDTDGSNDATFNPGTGADDFVTSIAIYSNTGSQNDGKIVVGGGFTSMNNIQRNGIARLNTDGSLDASFNPGTGANGVVRSVAVQADGKVVIAGEFTQVNGVARINVARLNADGSVDTSFDPGAGPDGIIWSVVVAETPSRKIFVGGEFLEFSGAYRGYVARLNENGSLDLSYDSGGGADGPVYAMVALPDGRLLIGGYFENVDFTPRSRIARLLSTGGLDPTFNPGTGANDAVYSLTLQVDGKAMVGGLFTSFNGTRRMGLTRLFDNGTVDTSFLDTAYNNFAGLNNTYGFEAPNYVNAVALQSDGAVMIGGSFHQVGGNFAQELNDNNAPYLAGNQFRVWTRADKRVRYNVARLVGGYTIGPGNVGYVLEQNTTDENSGTLTVPLERIDGRLGTAGARATTVDNLATNGFGLTNQMDFFAGAQFPNWFQNSMPLEPISVGQVGEKFYRITITDDDNIEGDELFGLRLTAPSGSINLNGDVIPLGAALALPEAVATITDNDFSKGILAFGAATYFTNENVSSMRVTVTRTNGSSGLISVRYYTYNGSALAGSDYTGVTLGTLSFGSGETTKTLTIPLNNDNNVEPDEDFFLVLTNATGGARIYSSNPLGNTATNSVTARAVIIDNDLASGKANFASASFTSAEAAGTAQITLQRLGGSVGQLQVNVAAFAGSAVNSVDFTGSTNTVVWVNGDVTPKTVTVALLDDSSVEGNETVNLQLISPFPLGATGAVNTATLTIADDDFYGSLSFSQQYYDADERGTNVTITVVRTGGLGGTVSVDYSTADASAVSPTDFLAASGTLTFGPGVMATNFEVTVVNNGLEDIDRTATLSLSGFVNATAGTIATADLRILDDESVGDPAGSLDTTFTPLAGSSNAIYSLVIQPDGKLIAGGEFRTLNRTLRNRVGRLNTNGTLDISFNARGGPNGTVRSMALQSDGRLVIGGFFTSIHSTNRSRIARLLADGSVDRFFNPGAGADNPVYAVALCPDGRIAVGGAFTTMNGIARAGIVLLETNGTVSTTFNPGLGAAGTVFAVAVQPDGKIIIGGDFELVNGSSHARLARLNLDGSVDTTFDVGTGPSGTVRAIALQPDGKILIGGSFTDVNGTARGRLARVTSSGSVDTSFMAAVDGADGDVNAIAIQFDSKIIVAGEFARFNDVSRHGITRLYRTGKTDPTINFGRGTDDAVNTVVVQVDRKMVIGGRFTSYDGQSRAFLARLHGGSIAGAGAMEFTTPFFEVMENGTEAVITVQRRGGTTGDVTVDYQTLADTATAGSDYTTAVGTLTFLEAETFQSFVVPILDDTVGEATEVLGLMLTNATTGAILGAVPNAYLSIINDDSGIGFTASSYTVNEGVAGNAVLITVTRVGATSGTATVGYRTVNGTAVAGQDYTAQSGLLTFGPGVDTQAFSVAVSDDSLIESAETFSLVLTNATGSSALAISSATVTIVDNDFRAGDLTFSATSYSVAESGGFLDVDILRTNGSTGVLSVDYATVNGTAIDGIDFVAQSGTLTFVEGQTSQTITLVIVDDGLVEGDESFAIRLLNPSSLTVISGPTNVVVTIVDEEFGPGSLDRTFDPGLGANDIVRAIATQSDGGILVGGAFTAFDGVSNRYVTRLVADGANDPTFDPDGGPNGLVTSLAVTSDGRAVLGGAFTEFEGLPFNQVARALTNGLVDLNFSSNPGFNGSVNTLRLQSDGRMLVGGAFSLPTRGVVRLRTDGTIDTTFIPGFGVNGPVHSLFVQTDGRVLVGGAFTTADGVASSRVARFHADGSLDGSFTVSAITNGTVYAMTVQQNGQVVVAGEFSTTASTNVVRITRLNTDGSLDSGFSVGTGANGVVFALGVNSSNQVVLGGSFSTINGTNRNRFARLHSDGSLDTGFDPGPGANGTVFTLSVLPSDDILIGGDFTSVNGAVRNRLARILGGGVAFSPTASVAAASGQLHLQFSAQSGRTYRLEASSNLVDWIAVGTKTATSTTVDWTQSVSGSSSRYFRVRVMQ